MIRTFRDRRWEGTSLFAPRIKSNTWPYSCKWLQLGSTQYNIQMQLKNLSKNSTPTGNPAFNRHLATPRRSPRYSRTQPTKRPPNTRTYIPIWTETLSRGVSTRIRHCGRRRARLGVMVMGLVSGAAAGSVITGPSRGVARVYGSKTLRRMRLFTRHEAR